VTAAQVKLPAGHRVVAIAEGLSLGPVLDIGAGAGLLETFAATPYVAVDSESAALASSGLRVVAAATNLPFRAGAASTTACVSVLQYVVDAEAAVRELRRVTRTGGIVVLLVPNLSYARNIAKLAAGRFPWSSVKDDWHSGTVRYFTRRDLAPMLERSGFRIRRIRCSGRMRRLRTVWPDLLGADLLFELEPRDARDR
jgi:SAM-dependent methyltransferase